MTRTFLALAVSIAVLGAATTSLRADMSRFEWSERPLVVFTPGAGVAEYKRQLAIAARHAEGFSERDIVVLAVLGDGPVFVGRRRDPDLDARDLRQRFGVPRERFQALLVGKDGTVKLRADGPISAERLFRTIDSMPMRQREMQERKEKARQR